MRASAVAALAWSVAFVITFLTRRLASGIGLLDEPNQRSSHTTTTPNGGGLGLVFGGSFAAMMLPTRAELGTVLLLSLMIAGVGLRDDIRHVAASVRLATQLVAMAGALFALGAFQTANPVLAALALIGGVWWINLFNFMDGIDGMAGIQALFMLLAAVCLAVWQHPHVINVPEWIWMIAIAAAVVAFLQFNWPPATIFMGDVGSTWLAFVMFAVAAISVRDGWMTTSTWLILGGVFIVDSTTTLLCRMFRQARWFEAHRSHAYQRLAVRLRSHRLVILLVSAINLLWLAPVACASLLWPEWTWFLTGVAYIPLIAASLSLGAGREGDVSSTVTPERM
jgi:Fuc2NAc and GlcNAc transferase